MSTKSSKLRVLVTAGPTRELLDPVRFLSNVSTGTMGYLLAKTAKRMGCQVTLVSGPTALAPPRGVQFVPVVSAREMKRAVGKRWSKTDVLIMTAAVCDYTPLRFSRAKIKRIKQKTIRFKRTEDILKSVSKRKGHRTVVGFSLETENYVHHARRKLRAKNLDLIVLNWYGAGNNPFGTHRASMVLIGRDGEEKMLRRVSKAYAAKTILKEVMRVRREAPMI